MMAVWLVVSMAAMMAVYLAPMLVALKVLYSAARMAEKTVAMMAVLRGVPKVQRKAVLWVALTAA